MSRCLIIINPVSGGGAARRYALDLQWKLSTLFETIEVKFTRGEGDATRFAKNACERGFDAVFCMGGDGTVNETVNGIAQGGFSCTFGFIPVGTVNDMSRALGIHQNPTQAIRRIDINETRTIDIGRCKIGISAIILQLVLFLRLWMKLRQKKKHTRPSCVFLASRPSVVHYKGLHVPHQNRERRFHLQIPSRFSPTYQCSL